MWPPPSADGSPRESDRDLTDEGSQPAAAALSDLIGLIYDTARDHTLWPRLLQCMAGYLSAVGSDLPLPLQSREAERTVASWFDGSGAPVPIQGTAGEAERDIFSCLAPHFIRAQALQRQFLESDEQRRLAETALDQLPLGIAVVERTGVIVSINRTLLVMLRQHSSLTLLQGRLVSRPQKTLSEALAQVSSGSCAEVTLRLEDEHGPLSVRVCSVPAPDQNAQNTRALLWIAGQDPGSIPASGLQALFGTTPAESRLIQRLVSGASVDDAARDLGVSRNTAKTHLKSVYAKLGVSRLSELVQTIYSTPLWLQIDADASAPPPAGTTAIGSIRLPRLLAGQSMLLPDGRHLAWSDSGDHAGLPVILMHGISGSRHLRHPDDRILHEEGIRLIIPERPGTGDSDPLPGRQVQDWPKDVEALADHLGLPRFVVLGYSAGTPYALTTAHRLPDRVLASYIASATPPIERIEDLKAYSAQFRMTMLVARYSPSLLPPLLRIVVKSIRKNLHGYVEHIMRGMPESDRTVLENPVFRENYVQGLLAGVKHGEQYLVSEALLAVHGWSTGDAKFSVPVEFFHGDADWHITADSVRRLVEQIPGARLHIVSGAGHFLLYSHWRELLRIIRGRTLSLLHEAPQLHAPQ